MDSVGAPLYALPWGRHHLSGTIMIAVISEVWPFPDRLNEYVSLSNELRPHLEAIDGFISSERFESVKEPGKYVSVSYWRDE